MAEDYIQLPPDGTGKKVRAIRRPDNRYEEVMIPYSKDGEIDLRQLHDQLASILSELKQKLETTQLNIDVEKDLQVDVRSTANPPNLNVPLSTRASEATLSSIEGKVATESSLVSALPRTITDVEKVANVTKYLAPTALSAGGTATIWTPATGKKARPKFVSVSVDARTRIELRWGTTPFESHFLPADGNIIFNLIGANDEGAVDESLTLLSSEAVTVTATARGDEV